ncbi:hypothetical protein [Frankia sp. R43]|uniref:hypothetical protein n=1 Tax=Frankia sp. R43 TaxID=269536 RepID=UPI000AB40CB7|nr:hypothetical protein [Frankia sp. R43]
MARADSGPQAPETGLSAGAGGSPRWIAYVPLGEVREAERNAKAHDLDHIKALITRFGFAGSAVHDGRTGRIIAGHGRLESLRAMEAEGQDPPDGIVRGEDGTWRMPVEHGWSSRSDAEAEALGVALNEATTRGGWDEPALTGLLADLDSADAELRRLAGWDDTHFDALVALCAVPGPSGAGMDGGESPAISGDEADQAVLDDTDRAAWPVIRAQVSHELYARWRSVDGADDAARVGVLLDLAGT